jgi:hypothetical protein
MELAEGGELDLDDLEQLYTDTLTALESAAFGLSRPSPG